MITEIKDRIAEGNIPAEQSGTFTIKAGGKAFKTLISNLYTDKVRAVVTEICANAYDAHVAAKNTDSPFEVTLPSVLDPLFRVRDFGTGISYDFMMNYYTVAFHSSKDTSNDFNGEKGLGRLSALALCDSYFCYSVQNGEKSSYSIFYNPKGIPTIAYLGSEKTSEKNGFCVEIPVNASYVYHFMVTAQQVFKPYIVKPLVFGNSSYAHLSETAVFSGRDWSLFGAGRPSAARCSVYEYPINASSIPNLEQKYHDLLSCGLVIQFPIGKINTAANREALDYDETTIANIKEALSNIYIDIGLEIQKQFDNKSLFEKIKIRTSIFSYEGRFARISNLVNSFLKTVSVPDRFEPKGISFYIITQRYGSPKIYGPYGYVDLKNNYEFIIFDKKTHASKRLDKYIDGNHTKCGTTILIEEVAPNAFKETEETFGVDFSKCKKMSELDYDKSTTKRNKRQKNQLYTVKKAVNFRRNQDIWEVLDYSDYYNVYYVLRTGTALNSDKGTLKKQIQTLHGVGVDDYSIVGLTTTEWERLEKEGIELDSFEDFYSESLQDFIKQNEKDIQMAIVAKSVFHYDSNDHASYYKNSFFRSIFGIFSNESILKEIENNNNAKYFYDIISEWKNANDAYKKYNSFIESMTSVDLLKMKEAIKASYPVKNPSELLKKYPVLSIVKAEELNSTEARKILYSVIFN